uniref:non-specific serine/threonine protein kinase n=1 Tax=Quercus lobata TaxID=97700 RepID=A0A7N2LJM3_QUELO
MVGSSPFLASAFCGACIFGQLFELAQAQNRTQAATDPAEVENHAVEQPSTPQVLTTKTTTRLSNVTVRTIVSRHITQLRAYALNVVGVIPDELWTLTFLFNLNLGQNYLTGNLFASIGKLYRMQYLSFNINALSGTLPKELGNLTYLISLSFSTNNFTGSLPSELGNLVKLEQLYFDSFGDSGAIPSTFANLKSLVIVWASDIELTGRILDFIGNWKLEGNSLEGPIPLAFSNLTSLTELRISDLSNGSSSLAFIKNMKSLSTLVLRNNNISYSIPSNIGEYLKLSQLDLSFNNITGQIPNALFSLSSLSFFDLSYNNLQGSFPSWVNEQNLQLNLVANNFTIEGSNSSVLPSGLSGLQRGFPCNHGIGRCSEFAIKCGGPHITSSNGILYERDNETLGPVIYYVVDTERWVLSNVGYFSGSNNAQYTSSSLSQFTNTLDLELFQTARLSASSLRYYGLGLENGNYTVSLRFAEIAFVNSNTWQSLGRRVFDIYILGNLVLKDFDLQKEAGGASFVAVQKEYNNVQVSQNYLEIHLFWAGKGTCCVPAQEFTPTVSNSPPSSNKNRTGLIVGLLVGVGVVSFLAVFIVFYIVRRRKPPTNDDEELLGIDAKTFTFSYAELKTATEDFNPDNKLGEGGFGPVYKGTLNDGRVIAVKQLSVTSHQGKNQFLTEIATIFAVQHCNLVKLYGCCIEGDKQLLVKKNLESRLVNTLRYMLGCGKSGYLAPEYAMRGHLTEKADVFAFGVVALELVSGRPNSDSSLEEEKIYLPEWRVVAMLFGDIEVCTVTSRPGYLTDWKCDDITNVTSEGATDSSYFNSSRASTSIVGDVGNSLANASKPMIGDTIKQGR